MTDEPQEIKIENQGADAERAQSIQREHAEIHLQADPGLDPNAPDFDPAAYKAALTAAGGMDAITGQIREKLGASLRAIETTMLNTLPALAQTGKAAAEQAATEELATQEQTLAGLISTTLEVLKGFAEFVNSDTYKAIKESMAAIGGFVKQHRAEIALLAEAAQEVQDLAPFLAIEIEDAKQDPAFADLTLETLVEQGFLASERCGEGSIGHLGLLLGSEVEDHGRAAGAEPEFLAVAEPSPRRSIGERELDYPVDYPVGIDLNRSLAGLRALVASFVTGLVSTLSGVGLLLGFSLDFLI